MRNHKKLYSIGFVLAFQLACASERPDFSEQEGHVFATDGAGGAGNTDAEAEDSPESDRQDAAVDDVATDAEGDDDADSGRDTAREPATDDAEETDTGLTDPEVVTDGPSDPDSGVQTEPEPDTQTDDPTDPVGTTDTATDSGETDGVVPAEPELIAVELVLASDLLSALDDTTTFEVLCHFDNDDSEPCTDEASIDVEKTTVVTLDEDSGEFVPVTNGTSEIVAIVDGLGSEPTTLTVDLGPICTTLRLTGAASAAAGTTVEWTASCDYDDGRSDVDVTDEVSWESSAENVASVSDAGVVSASQVGAATISASLDNPDESTQSVGRTFAVTNGELVSIAITATDATQVPAGLATSFTAECEYTDVTADCTAGVTWASSNPSVATIGADGTASANIEGQTNVSANSGGITSNVISVTVTAPVLVGVLVTPNSGITAQVNTSRQLTATCTMSDDTSTNCTNLATWNSSPPGIVTIDSSGKLVGQEDGTTLVSATREGISSSAVTVTVVPPAGCENAIDFPDEVMLQDVRDITGRAAGPIYYEDVKAITSFEHSQGNGFLEFLTGVECFTSLKTLIVERAWLEDLSDIVGLIHLETLRVGFTSVSSLPDLSLLTELSEVDLSYTQISDLYALVNADQLGAGDTVSVTNTNLDCSDSWILGQIADLEARGVAVTHSCE